MVARAADGTTYDTRVPLRNETGVALGPTKIPPGTTKTVPEIGKYLRVRWQGPLRVTAGCGQSALPVLRQELDELQPRGLRLQRPHQHAPPLAGQAL